MRNFILVVIAALFLVPRPLPAAEEKIFRATVDSDGVQRVEVVGGSYFFNPNHIVVKAGVPVELKVRKESGWVPHNLVVKAPEAGIEIDEPLDSDKAKTIRFTPTKTGTYPMYCSKKLLFFESHREKGMEGMIEVVP
ncbi:MAG TPA: cupredoxin domain-containing protein [Geobacteraceae bacterium]